MSSNRCTSITDPIIDGQAALDVTGVRVSNFSSKEALACFHDHIAEHQHLKICFLNAHCANVAQSNLPYRKALEEMVVLADGVGVDIGAKMLHGQTFKANLNGTDFVPLVITSARKPLKIGLYGARPGIANKAMTAFLTLDPRHDIRVVGDGYIDSPAQLEMLGALENWHPDILLVAKGVPAQELWIAEHIKPAHCTLVFGVGALFDFAAGAVRRAPKWMRDLRIEWVYRLLNEPKRLFQRYVFGNPLFIMHVIKYKLNAGLKRK